MLPDTAVRRFTKVLQLPDPPDAVDHAMVQVESRITGRGKKILQKTKTVSKFFN
jgi:hypothetical protein